MPKGFSFNLTGLPAFDKKIKNLNTQISKDLVDEMSASTMKIEKDAKKAAPVNMGQLRNSIHAVSYGPLTHAVVSYASYAPYIEFGTGGKVSIPAGYDEIASQFKGKGGGKLEEMIQALTQWVKRKGLAGTYSVKTQKRTGNRKAQVSEDEKLARFLAFKILKNGIRPQPFMIPAYEQEKPKLIERLKKRLNAKS